MFQFFKALFSVCNHDWQEVDTKLGYYHAEHLHLRTHLYCPHCDTRKTVDTDNWRRKKTEDEIKRNCRNK